MGYFDVRVGQTTLSLHAETPEQAIATFEKHIGEPPTEFRVLVPLEARLQTGEWVTVLRSRELWNRDRDCLETCYETSLGEGDWIPGSELTVAFEGGLAA